MGSLSTNTRNGHEFVLGKEFVRFQGADQLVKLVPGFDHAVIESLRVKRLHPGVRSCDGIVGAEAQIIRHLPLSHLNSRSSARRDLCSRSVGSSYILA